MWPQCFEPTVCCHYPGVRKVQTAARLESLNAGRQQRIGPSRCSWLHVRWRGYSRTDALSDRTRDQARAHTDRSQGYLQPMTVLNPIARLIGKLRGYFRDVHEGREELADSIPSENVLPPIPPADGKRLR